MKKYRTFYNITLFFTITAALSLTAIRTFALLTEFETSAGYYAQNAFLNKVFGIGALITAIIVFALAFLLRRSFSDITPETDSGIIIFSSALLAFMIIAVFISDIFSLDGMPSFVKLLTLILAIPAALYPLIGIALPIRSKNGKILLGALILLWLFSITLSIYFNGNVAINNPNRSLELAAVAVVLLYFVYECRYALGSSTPWCYIGFGLASVIVLGMYTLPNVILVLTKLYPDKLDVTFEFILAVIWVYILLRMCVYSAHIAEPDEKAEDENDEDNVNDTDGENDAPKADTAVNGIDSIKTVITEEPLTDSTMEFGRIENKAD